MPPSQTIEGLDAARAIRAEFPEIGILVLSAETADDHRRVLAVVAFLEAQSRPTS